MLDVGSSRRESFMDQFMRGFLVKSLKESEEKKIVSSFLKILESNE